MVGIELGGRIADRYVVLEELGGGGMGVVFRARDEKEDRDVAIKVLRYATWDIARRLRREARATRSLDPRRVARVHEVGETPDGVLYLVMEYVPGPTLRALMRAGRVARCEALRIVREVATALGEAHRAGIVHRDVKPENIIVGEEGRVVLVDFGIVKNVASGDDAAHVSTHLTAEGDLIGTPAYLAPEQALGQKIGPEVDQFALGVTAYGLLTGVLPWRATEVTGILAQVLAETPAAASSVDPSVPPAFDAVLWRALAKESGERFASIEEFADALEAAEQGRSLPAEISRTTDAASMALLERAARPSRSRWMVAGILATAGLAAVAYGRVGRSNAPGTAVASPPAPARAKLPGCSPSRCAAEHGGAAYACRPRDGACVPIASEDCVAAFEPADLTRDDTVWIGAAFPTKGPAADAFGTMNAQGVDFARKEIADATVSLEGTDASKHVRRIAVVTCDDGTDADRAMHHLVDDVGVPAVLGFGSGQKLVDLAGSFLIPHQVLAIATLTTNPLVTRVPQPADLPRMVWRTTYSRADVAVATAHFLHDVIEPRVPQAGRPTRLTLARIDLPAGAWFGDELYRRAVFNGKSADDNGDAYAEVLMPAKLPAPDALHVLADRVIATHPTFLVLTGDTAVMAPLVVDVEARWDGDGRRAPRPTYILSDDSTQSLAAFMGSSVERRRRVFAVTTLSNGAPGGRFVIRYNESHDKKVTRYVQPETSYDALYLLAYATFSLGERPIDGPSLARAFARLVPPGKEIEVGPTAIFDGIAALNAGESIDLHGASSSLDFNLATGEPPQDFALVCADVDASGRAAGDRESGVYYRSASGTVEGAAHCP